MTESSSEDARVDLQSFLDETLDRLKQSDQTDIPLLDILAKHIVTLPPADNAVELAVKEIEALAAERMTKDT